MTTLRQISQGQRGDVVLMNDLFSSVSVAGLFGVDLTGTTGITFAYYGGMLPVDGVSTTIADGTLALTASQTNYIERTVAGVVSKNTTGFSADKIRLYTAVTSATGITTLTDHRHLAEQPRGLISVSVAGGAGDTTLTADQARPEIIVCTGALTGNRGVVLPQQKRRWTITNSTTGTFTLTAKTSSGTGVSIMAGKTVQVYWDGTNMVLAETGGAQVKVGSFTRDVSTASGNQAVTGVGFKPRALIFMAALPAVTGGISTGVDDDTAAGSNRGTTTASQFDTTTSISIMVVHSGGNFYQGVVNSLDDDGFTIAWTKTGTPTGTATVVYLALR